MSAPCVVAAGAVVAFGASAGAAAGAFCASAAEQLTLKPIAAATIDRERRDSRRDMTETPAGTDTLPGTVGKPPSAPAGRPSGARSRESYRKTGVGSMGAIESEEPLPRPSHFLT